MTTLSIAALVDALRESQTQMIAVLRSISGAGDWQPAPDEWSFRAVAAHMATVEEECFAVRLQRIVEEEHPRFDYYLNTGRDFSQHDLQESLSRWQQIRERSLSFVANLSADQRERTGNHATFGTIDVAGALQIMLEHDRDHLADLQAKIAAYREETG